MTADTFTVSGGLSFESAIDVTHSLLTQMEQGSLSNAAIEQAIAMLVASEAGARGFFVTYLSDDRPLADQPTPAVIAALKTSPTVVSSLLVKNLAMATAMALAHRRNQNQELAQTSERVKTRSALLIQAIQSPELAEQAQHLANSIGSGIGTYQSFLERWGYDSAQKQAIQQALIGTGLVE